MTYANAMATHTGQRPSHVGYIQNEQPKPFVWTKTADDILAAVARFCQRTSDSGH